MTDATTDSGIHLRRAPVVVVTGANGFVGSHVCAALVERAATVRALVRRRGDAPVATGVEEHVGDFTDPEVAAVVVAGADAVVTTVHPMGDDRAAQHRVGVEGTATLTRAAAEAGVGLLVHVSTAAVHDRSPALAGADLDESSALVGDDADDYAVTKRDADTALADVDGITRVLLRPPAILGPGATSIWNTLRPAALSDDEAARHAVPERSFPWVHVADLAVLAADLATGRIEPAGAPAGESAGPVEGGCTPVLVVAGTGTQRDYVATVCGALDVEPVWEDGPGWTGRLLADRARGWGWTPTVDLPAALAELRAGLR